MPQAGSQSKMAHHSSCIGKQSEVAHQSGDNKPGGGS